MVQRPGTEAARWLGLPVLPPAGLANRASRLRQRIQRGAGIGPPFVVVLERLFGIYDPIVLGLLCRNRVPEALVHGPAADAAGIAARLPTGDPAIDVDALHRVLRYAAMRGFLATDRRGRFRANHVTKVLTADHDGSARPWVEFLAGRSTLRIFEEADSALFGFDPCRIAHGTDFFTHVNEQSPDDGKAFNGAMQQGSYLQALLLADAIDFSTLHRVVDVGGGTGELARILLRHHPHLDVTVFDLPSVVTAAQKDHGDAGCHWVGGDFFAAVPAGADAYTLLAILHDWSDALATRILANVRTAMGPTGRCFVVDSTIDERHPQALHTATDIMMLLLTEGGKERTRVQWEQLATGARLRIASHRLLATGFSAYELVAA